MNLTDQTKLEGVAVDDVLASLTAKQREVLDLLIQFKTSKEISRILEISPHTVDQRVDAARNKLGAASRAELALIYRDLVGHGTPIYERLTYEDSYVVPKPEPAQEEVKAQPTGLAYPENPDIAGDEAATREERDYRVVPELFDGRWGTLARLLTILGITVMLCFGFLGGLATFMEVSQLFMK